MLTVIYKYDDSIKKWYLEIAEKESRDATYKLILSHINKISEWEERFEKSFTDFTLEENITMLRGFRIKSQTALSTAMSLINRYGLFACSKLAKASCQFQLIDITMADKIINRVASEQRYIMREDLFDSLSLLETRDGVSVSPVDVAMDKLMLVLIFEGICGKAYKDLLSIQKEDIDFENRKVYLRVTDRHAYIEDSRTWDLLSQVYSRESVVHITQDGKQTVVPMTSNKDMLFIRPVILKTGYKKGDDGTGHNSYEMRTLNDYAAKMRIRRLAEGIDMPYLRGSTLYVSGLAERCYKWLKETGKVLSFTVIKEYLELFNEGANVNTLVNLIEDFYGMSRQDTRGGRR